MKLVALYVCFCIQSAIERGFFLLFDGTWSLYYITFSTDFKLTFTTWEKYNFSFSDEDSAVGEYCAEK